MPKSMENAKIALLDVALEIEKTETDARIEITSPEQMQAFLQQEEKMLKDMVEKIGKSKANVVFTQKGIDDVAQHFLAKAGIIAVRRVKKSDMEKLARATEAKIVTSLDDLKADDLGLAGMVEERKISGEHMVFVEKCKDPKSVTIFVQGRHRAGGRRSREGNHGRDRRDIKRGRERQVRHRRRQHRDRHRERLRDYASDVGGREQLAIQKFADAARSSA